MSKATSPRATTQTTTASVHAVYGTPTSASAAGATATAAAPTATAAAAAATSIAVAIAPKPAAAAAAAASESSSGSGGSGGGGDVTLEWCRAVPKVELHAHLSGSVRASTLRELLDAESAHLAAVAAAAAAVTATAAAAAATATAATATATSVVAPATRVAPAAAASAGAAVADSDATKRGDHKQQPQQPQKSQQSQSHALRFAAESAALASDDRSLDECFKIFAVLHRVVNNGETLRRITHEVIDDFAADGVAYLELRTTPRALPFTRSPFTAHLTGAAASKGDAPNPALSKREALQIVLDAMRDAEARHRSGSGIRVRLLLSVDRTASVAEADDTVALARDLCVAAARDTTGTSSARYVVGLDFSGNPMKSTFAHFAQVFERARAPYPTAAATASSSASSGDGKASDAVAAGAAVAAAPGVRPLRVSVHTAEVDDDSDTRAIVHAYRPDRLGHAVFLKADDVAFLKANPIPIEICVTSNCKLMTVQSFHTHPFGALYAQQYPIVLSTDDSGVFGITLSSEYHGVARAWGLTRAQVLALAARACDYTFLCPAHSTADADALAALKARFAAAQAQLTAP